MRPARAARVLSATMRLRISAVERDGATIVVGRVAGDFPNSPLNLDHIFRLNGDQIASLEIR